MAPSLPLGEPPKRLKPAAAAAWNEFRDELPWLDCSHGGILGIAAILRGRMAVGDPSSKAMNLLRLCLGQATLAQRIVAQIDYGSNKTISKIQAVGFSLFAGTDTGEAFCTSTDGTNWTIYGTTIGPQTFNQASGNITARYNALVAKVSNWSTITMSIQDFNGFQPTTNNATPVKVAQTNPWDA